MIYITDTFRPEMVTSDENIVLTERQLFEITEYIIKKEPISNIRFFCKSHKSFNILKGLLDIKDIFYSSNTKPSQMLISHSDMVVYISHNFKPVTVRNFSQIEISSSATYRIHLITVYKGYSRL